MPLIYKEVEVDIDLDDFEDDDLIDECERRGLAFSSKSTPTNDLIRQIYEAKTLGKEYDTLLNELFYNSIGRIA